LEESKKVDFGVHRCKSPMAKIYPKIRILLGMGRDQFQSRQPGISSK